MIDTAILLTSFNRPRLICDAIASVLQQDCDNWRLYVLDDGSSDDTRAAIMAAVEGARVVGHNCAGDNFGVPRGEADQVRIWHGIHATPYERRSKCRYSYTINVALNELLRDEQFVCCLADDDYFYPESVRARRQYLLGHPEAHVVYGRLRAVQYDEAGYNHWRAPSRANEGRHYPRPDGPVYSVRGGRALLHYWHGYGGVLPHWKAGIDPETGRNYVEEGFWQATPLDYERSGFSVDHNQVMWRRSCLGTCVQGPEWWPEHGDVGDAEFFRKLGAAHPFYAVDAWTATKRFHKFSDGRGEHPELRRE